MYSIFLYVFQNKFILEHVKEYFSMRYYNVTITQQVDGRRLNLSEIGDGKAETGRAGLGEGRRLH